MKNINVLHPVHKDVTERLSEINKALARDVQRILAENKADRHLRGGRATKEKYAKIKQNKQSDS